MANFTKDNLFKDKNMAKDYIDGQMKINTMGISKWIRDKDQEYIYGQIKAFTEENGDWIE